MQVNVGDSILELVEGDITRQDTDAIVNAANSQLRVGGGVDGAINRAGGPRIQEEARRIGYCPTGQAVITTAGDLPARHVIHAVGPIFQGGDKGEPDLLASAYRESLKLASAHGLASVAFPSLSTGVYGYPVDQAGRVALKTVRDYLTQHPEIKRVRFVLFGQPTFEAYARALQELS
ncbi:MAG: O-acetyl-ADP-ribose deacetylase [Deltaproteobacteria bacterium]|nr:O-acetyl-ADP-ribose deacetylase [Deltaproteobacteria bacterium]